MSFPKTYRTNAGWALSIGAILALFSNLRNEQRAVISLAVLGALGFLWSAWEHEWIRWTRKSIPRVILILGGFFLIALSVWPPPPLPLPEMARFTSPPTATPELMTRYLPSYLPLAIESKKTLSFLPMNPRITYGLFEQTNNGASEAWWPTKVIKGTRPREPIFVCQFTNYGSKALLATEVTFNLSFYSVKHREGTHKREANGTYTDSATMPEDKIPGAGENGLQRMMYIERFKGKTTVINPGEFISTHKHKVVIPAIPAGATVSIYLVNQSKFFARFEFPESAVSLVSGDSKKEFVVLVRPDVNIGDEIPESILPPPQYHWAGVPDAP
jgi:hypothetical protein